MLFTTVMKSNKEFSRAYNKGRYCVSREVCVYYIRNSSPFNKLGITTSKKLGNAVQRNRARRIIRAAYRLSEEFIPIGFDMVVVARSGIIGKKSTDIERFFKGRLPDEIRRSENERAFKK